MTHVNEGFSLRKVVFLSAPLAVVAVAMAVAAILYPHCYKLAISVMWASFVIPLGYGLGLPLPGLRSDTRHMLPSLGVAVLAYSLIYVLLGECLKHWVFLHIILGSFFTSYCLGIVVGHYTRSRQS